MFSKISFNLLTLDLILQKFIFEEGELEWYVNLNTKRR